MADIKNWSEVANDNSETSPDGAPEGMARSGVNDTMRENMRAIRKWYAAAEWVIVYETTGDSWTASKHDADTIKLAPDDAQTTNITTRFPDDSRVRLSTGGTAPFQYGFVNNTSFSSPNTFVDVDIDDGSDITNGTDTIEIGIVRDMLEKTAYYPTGATTSQTPPQVPTIDDLGTHVTKAEGDGGGIDADTVDGLHANQIVAVAAAAGKNVVYNPEFSVWQRGTTIDADTTSGRIYTNDHGNYAADRWRLLSGNRTSDTNDMVDVARNTTSPPTGYYTFATLTGQTVIANDKAGLFQVLEARDSAPLIKSPNVSMGVELMGGTITQARYMILGWSGGADHANLGNDPFSDWGNTGDTPTPAANWAILLDSGQETITGSWARYTTEDVDFSAATTVTNIGILVYIDDTWAATNTLNITGIRVEASSVAAAFQHTEQSLELLRCQRYYTNTFDEGTDPRDNVGIYTAPHGISFNRSGAGDDNFALTFQYPVQMRATPTIKVFNPGSTTADAFWDQRDATTILKSSMSNESIQDRHVTWSLQASDIGRVLYAHIAADAEF